MKIDVLTLFPAMFAGPLDESIVQRAREAGLVDLRITDLRDCTHDRHKTVDDRPFGGGPGMVLKPEPIFEAVEKLAGEKTHVILMSPAGRIFDQAIARELAAQEHLLFISGSYEGFDERVREALADDEISIGDYVLTNGALPAMVVIDAVTRLLPGVLGDEQSAHDESFSHGLAGISALHAAGGIPRNESAGDFALGPPRGDREVASGTGAEADGRTAPGFVGQDPDDARDARPRRKRIYESGNIG